MAPGNVSAKNSVPDSVEKPDYFYGGAPKTPASESAEIKGKQQIARMRESCKLAANILKKTAAIVQVRTKTIKEVLELKSATLRIT